MYRGKRFLITQPILYNFCGSTMVTIELARYLASEGLMSHFILARMGNRLKVRLIMNLGLLGGVITCP